MAAEEGPLSQPNDAEREAILQLDQLGIEVVAVKNYLWGGYRYSSARDAVAAARRAQKV